MSWHVCSCGAWTTLPDHCHTCAKARDGKWVVLVGDAIYGPFVNAEEMSRWLYERPELRGRALCRPLVEVGR